MNLSNSIYSEPINNTIFERKHHFMYILKEAEILKSQINDELIYGSIEASRLDEINSICTLAFAGLIQEGLAYRYERDTDPNRDTFVITVDRTEYRCRTQALKPILKNKFPELNNVVLPRTAPETLLDQITKPTETQKQAAYKPAESLLSEPVVTAEASILTADHMAITTTEPKSDSEAETPAAPIIKPGISEEKSADDMLSSFMSDILGSEESESLNEAKEEKADMKIIQPFTADGSAKDTVAFSAESETLTATQEENTEKAQEIQAIEKNQEASIVQDSLKAPTPKSGFEVIGATPVTSISSISFFKDEPEKHKDSFVYQTVRATVRHEGSSKTEEIYFMIAPIEMKKDEISTKIIAYAYLNGKAYAQTSIQNEISGRNTISLCVGEYEFLIRGIFEDYKFSASILTDGITARQNDIFTILETVNYAPKSGLAQNGHIKFRYDADGKQDGLIEVFPLGFDKNNFVILRQYGEWIDVIRTEEEKILTQTIDGLQELVCAWEGDVLKAEFVPAY